MHSVPSPAHPLPPASPRLPHNVIPIARRRNPLALWHLLSLDAPTVAALWTYFIASANHIHLRWTSIAAMSIAVWLLYSGDRLLDSRILAAAPNRSDDIEARHRFHHHHRAGFRLGIAAASLLLAVLLPSLPAEAMHLYLVEGSFLTGYFLLIHAGANSFRLPKEFAVGLFFAAAVFIPAVARAPALRLPLLAPALLFAALCTLNCLYIYAWEHPTHATTAHLTTRLALQHLRGITCVILAAAGTLSTQAPRHIPLAIAASTALMLLLHHYRRAVHPTTLRAAADLALLTPILFLTWR